MRNITHDNINTYCVRAFIEADTQSMNNAHVVDTDVSIMHLTNATTIGIV